MHPDQPGAVQRRDAVCLQAWKQISLLRATRCNARAPSSALFAPHPRFPLVPHLMAHRPDAPRAAPHAPRSAVSAALPRRRAGHPGRRGRGAGGGIQHPPGGAECGRPEVPAGLRAAHAGAAVAGPQAGAARAHVRRGRQAEGARRGPRPRPRPPCLPCPPASVRARPALPRRAPRGGSPGADAERSDQVCASLSYPTLSYPTLPCTRRAAGARRSWWRAPGGTATWTRARPCSSRCPRRWAAWWSSARPASRTWPAASRPSPSRSPRRSCGCGRARAGPPGAASVASRKSGCRVWDSACVKTWLCGSGVSQRATVRACRCKLGAVWCARACAGSAAHAARRRAAEGGSSGALGSRRARWRGAGVRAGRPGRLALPAGRPRGQPHAAGARRRPSA